MCAVHTSHLIWREPMFASRLRRVQGWLVSDRIQGSPSGVQELQTDLDHLRGQANNDRPLSVVVVVNLRRLTRCRAVERTSCARSHLRTHPDAIPKAILAGN